MVDIALGADAEVPRPWLAVLNWVCRPRASGKFESSIRAGGPMAYGFVAGAGLFSGSYFAHVEAPWLLNGISD